MVPGRYRGQAVLTGTPAPFTGTIAGLTLTLAAPPSAGAIAVNAVVTGVGVTAATKIVSGSGLIWTVNNSQNVGPVSMVATLPTRLVVSEGSMLVELDLANVSGPYDARTTAQIGLAAAELALMTYQQSGGRIKEYQIGGRRMMFQDDRQLIAEVSYWRGRVEAELQAQSGGDRRNIRIKFARASSGTPASGTRNWPWR
jgi:hypothetical protein